MSTISPNMSLVVPTVGVDTGLVWEQSIEADLGILDGHNHTPGYGVQITPEGLNINSDLNFQINNATDLRTIRLFPNVTPISAVSPDLGVLYEAGVDLYFNDGSGNQIRITQSGSVAGASGTITGLPSGTASASYSSVSGTFVFQQATGISANLDIGTLILRYPGSYPTPTGNFISLEAPTSLSIGFSLTFPPNLPANNNSAIVYTTSGIGSYLDPDQIGQSMTSVGADAIGQSMTSVGADAIASNTINPLFGGTYANSDGNSVITSGVFTNYTLKIIRGTVNTAGTILAGEGFTVTPAGVGTWDITCGFSMTPVVTATVNQSAAGYFSVGVYSQSTSGFALITSFNGAASGQNFSFIAIG